MPANDRRDLIRRLKFKEGEHIKLRVFMNQSFLLTKNIIVILMCVCPCIVAYAQKTHTHTHTHTNQLDATEWFIALIICSTCFGHFYAHHQELEIICVITAYGVRCLGCWLSEVRYRTAGYASGVRDVARATSLTPDAQPAQWRTEEGFGEVQLPLPKFRSFDKVEPNCKLSGKCLVFLFEHPNQFKNC